MITSKQRAYLRGLANRYDTIGQVGKGGISAAVIAQAETDLYARELIKYRVLETAMLTAKEAAIQLAEALNADVVQVIGTRFVLYRPNPDEPVIELK